MINQPPSMMRGFTLVELMVVIVIMAILAALIMLNITGVDQRKAAQARDFFIMDIQKIAREANDQSRILALDVRPATDVTDFSYRVVEYVNPRTSGVETVPTTLSRPQKWQPYAAFSEQILAQPISFSVTLLDEKITQNQNQDLTEAGAPKLIWFGNGEARPARIQFYFENESVGAEIEIDYLGKINASE